jgi:2-aminoadipate transaminase
MVTLWDDNLAAGARQIRSSAIRDLLHVTERPDIVSFAGGLPAPEYFPTDRLASAAAHVMAVVPGAALQYGPTEGYRPLRSWIAEWMARLGVPTTAEQVLITSGSQQGLDLLGKLLIDPGAPIIVENPTYVGALQAWRPYQPRFLTLPMDEHGLDLDTLARLLKSGERPRFLYIVSSFQNPTGTTLSIDRREGLLKLAAEHRLPIVEDDPYGDLYYEGGRMPPLAALDVALHGELRHVVYLSTFSKLLAPGLRVGWLTGAPGLIQRLVQAKQGLDLHTGSLAQATIYEACQGAFLDAHLPVLRRIYRERRDALLGALARTMPAGTHWTTPAGGMFLWVTLPEGNSATELFHAAIEHKVAFVPGPAFYANGGGDATLRLNFSHAASERIVEGVRRLGLAMAGVGEQVV